ncbi:MAG: anthranilate phosphoribosyltransferase [Candidatus Aminicenantia bacterium]
MIQEAIKNICEGFDLDSLTLEIVLEEILEGKATPAQISAFLVALKFKGENTNEIYALAKKLKEKAIKIPTERNDLIDLCGTGGDGKSTFNISTISTFVVAGAGVPVAKHGNRAVSGRCGSADLIEGLGIKLPDSPLKIKKSIDEIGIGFIFAPFFHPSMKNVQPVRKEIGVRTIFNLLGPLLNPAGVKRQLIGFFNEKAMEKVASALKKLGGERYFLVHSRDGLDEISISSITRAILIEGDRSEEIEIVPDDYGIKMREANINALSVEENIIILFSVLRGENSDFVDSVLINSGSALYVSKKARDIREGVEMARDSIFSGKAIRKLNEFIKLHREE